MKNLIVLVSVLFAGSTFAADAMTNHAQHTAKDRAAKQSRQYIKRKKMAQWFDATLLKSGAVDTKYKIIDEDRVKDFFDNVNKEMSSGDDGRHYPKAPLTKQMTFSPRGMTISNILQSNAADASQAELIKYYQSAESDAIMLAETCPFIEHSNYAQVNGYTATYQLINKHNKVVFQKNIDKAYCNRAGQ